MTKTMKTMKNLKIFRWGAICLAAFFMLVVTIPVKAQTENIFPKLDAKGASSSALNGSGTEGWTISIAESANDYWKLFANDKLVSPAINFSEWTNVTVTLALAKFGGPSNAQATVHVYVVDDVAGSNPVSIGTALPTGTGRGVCPAISVSSDIVGIKYLLIEATNAASDKGARFYDAEIKGEAVQSTDPLATVLGTTKFNVTVGESFTGGAVNFKISNIESGDISLSVAAGTNPAGINLTTSSIAFGDINAEQNAVNFTVGTLALGSYDDTIIVEHNSIEIGKAAVNITVSEKLGEAIFTEKFDDCGGTGGNDGSWSGSIAATALPDRYSDENWIITRGYAADECIKLGTSSGLGSVETPELTELSGNATLTFRAGAWNAGSESTTLKLSISGGGSLSVSSVTMAKGAFTEYTVDITGGTASSKIKFAGNATDDSRFFLDDIIIYAEAQAAQPTAEVVGGNIKNYDFDLGEESEFLEGVSFKVHNVTSDLTVALVPSAKSANLEIDPTAVVNPSDFTIGTDTTFEVMFNVIAETVLTADVYQDTIVVKQGDVVMAKAVINIVVNDLSAPSIAISGLEDAEGTSLTSFTADSVKVKFALANITEIAATINAKLQGDVEGTISYLESENEGTAELWLKNLASGNYSLTAEIVETDNPSNVIVSTLLPASFSVDLPNTANVTFHRGGITDANAANIELTDAASVTLESEGAAIYYTTDGSNPYISSTRKIYESVINVDTLVCTIKAVAIAPHSDSSEATSVTYTRTDFTNVSFSPANNHNFIGQMELTMTPTPATAEIRYTDNNDMPTAASTQYTTPITLSATTKIMAKAFIASDITPSQPNVANYTLVTPSAVTIPYFSGAKTHVDLTVANGYVHNGLTGNGYNTDPDSARFEFNAVNDELILAYSDTADRLEFRVKANPAEGSAIEGTMSVSHSTNGYDWTSIENIANLEGIEDLAFDLPETARYIRFNYDNRVSGSIGLGKIRLSYFGCADPVLTVVEPEETGAQLIWSEASVTTQNYEVKLSTDEDFSTVIETWTVSKSDTTIEDLTPGETYYYSVQAICSGSRTSNVVQGEFRIPAENEPEITVTSPAHDGSTIYDSVDVKFEFSTEHFVLGTDGNLEITIDGESAVTTIGAVSEYWYTGLISSTYNATFRLVDLSGEPLTIDKFVNRTFTVDLKDVETPVIPATGSYPDSLLVDLTCATAGATIYYSLNDGEKVIFDEPFYIKETSNIIVVAYKAGMDSSEFVFATYTITHPGETITYDLVTSADQLVAGKKYIIAAKTSSGVWYGLGASKGNYRKVVGLDSTKSSAPASFMLKLAKEAVDTTAIFGLTLGGSTDEWTFYDDVTPGYLNQPSDANSLSTVASTGTGTSWTIDFTADNVTEIISNRNDAYDIEFNSNKNQERFSTYKGTQDGVYLYVEREALPTVPTIIVPSTLTVNSPLEGTPGSNNVTIRGALLSANVTVEIDDDVNFTLSEDEFAFAEVNATGGVNLEVTYNGSAASATTTITLTSGSVIETIAVTGTTVIPIEVANLRALRDSVNDLGASATRYYKVIGEVFVSATSTNRNQKWVQDATAGIVIDDNSNVGGAFNIGDGVTGIIGSVTLYSELMQFIPYVSFGAATSTANSIDTIVLTAAEYIADIDAYESRLVRFNELTWVSTGTFATNRSYNLNDKTNDTVAIRTAIYQADYIGEAIPSGKYDIIGVGGNYNGALQVTPRSLSDMIRHYGVGVEDDVAASAAGLVVYPNPAVDAFNVKVAVPSVVTIFNATGAKVGVVSVGSEAVVKSLSSGLYLLRAVSAEGKVSTARVIIK